MCACGEKRGTGPRDCGPYSQQGARSGGSKEAVTKLGTFNLVEDPVRDVADGEVPAVGEEIVEHPVHPFQLPAFCKRQWRAATMVNAERQNEHSFKMHSSVLAERKPAQRRPAKDHPICGGRSIELLLPQYHRSACAGTTKP